MRKPPKKEHNGDYNFWQPATDMMTGLVFVLMLIVAVLGLYILNAYTGYEDATVDKPYNGTTAVKKYNDDQNTDQNNDDQNDDSHTSGDGSGGDNQKDEEEQQEQQQIITSGGGGRGYGTGKDDGIKSAVFVELVDEETDQIIQDEGVDFELYESKGALQILNTYYPDKISYRKYETREDGTFYLPEKILKGDYYLHELTAPEGYDVADDQDFTIDKIYDWSDPYVVKVPVSPSKNIIKVQLKDKDTNASVGNAVYKIVAAEDIVTLDGTVRYKKGQTAGTITCDENGYGESEPIYLGEYTLTQDVIPDYYTGLNKSPKVTVEKKTDKDVETQELSTEKTKLELKLTDELQTGTPIEGAVFTVTSEGDSGIATELKTDENGLAIMTDLEKETTYHIEEKTPAENYLRDTKEYTITVDSDGRINKKAKGELAVTNRMLRVSVRIEDKVLRKAVSGVKADLYSNDGNLVETWTTGENEQSFNGLKEGSYYILLNDNKDNRYKFEVKNVKEIQNWQITIFTWKSGVAVAGGAVAVILVLTGIIMIVKKLLRKPKQDRSSEDK